MSITIKDVAADAGVSTATVSHVINNTKYVSRETAGRVTESIKRLKYYPNQLVSGLRSKRSKTIGVVIPRLSNETFSALAEGLQRAFFELDYSIILCNTAYDLEMEEKALNTLIKKQAQAIIIVPVGDYSKKMDEIRNMGIPLILVDRKYNDNSADSVRVDNFKGEYDIVTYLIGLGHKRIGYIDRIPEQSHSLEQRKGYISALKDHGIPFDPDIVVNAEGLDFIAGLEAVQKLLKKAPDVTAVSAFYDVMAVGAMRGLADMGFSVPSDISVVGYDGMQFTEVISPRLTSVLYPVDLMVERIHKLVLDRLEEKAHRSDEEIEFTPIEIVIEPEIVIRESCSNIKQST